MHHHTISIVGNVIASVGMMAAYIGTRRMPLSERKDCPWMLPMSLAYAIMAVGIWLEDSHAGMSSAADYAAGFGVAIMISCAIIAIVRHRKASRQIVQPISDRSIQAKDTRIYNDWARPDPE